MYERDKFGSIPFAALIYGEEKAIKLIKNNKSRDAIECTFRESKEPIIIDIFNRVGVFAIKSIEKRLPKGKKLSLDNWQAFIDNDRTISTSKKIF